MVKRLEAGERLCSVLEGRGGEEEEEGTWDCGGGGGDGGSVETGTAGEGPSV